MPFESGAGKRFRCVFFLDLLNFSFSRSVTQAERVEGNPESLLLFVVISKNKAPRSRLDRTSLKKTTPKFSRQRTLDVESISSSSGSSPVVPPKPKIFPKKAPRTNSRKKLSESTDKSQEDEKTEAKKSDEDDSHLIY